MPPGRSLVRCAAGLAVKEPSTGVEFPLVRTFWVGEAQRNVGAGVRQKKLAFIGVKVRGRLTALPACKLVMCLLLATPSSQCLPSAIVFGYFG